MDKQLAIRRIRIAVSVFFGILTIAICTLWVRSYFAIDQFSGTSGHRFYHGGIHTGEIGLAAVVPTSPEKIAWSWYSEPVETRPTLYSQGVGYRVTRLPFGRIDRFANGWHVVFTLRSLFLSSCIILAAVWIRYTPRFSLRILLIATTLVAAVLGLSVWLAR